MSDEKPVPETLETIAEKISALGRSIDARFAQVDMRFDELKAQLRTEIEAVDARVQLVYEAVTSQQTKGAANDADHATFNRRLDNHDVRLLALERQKRNRG